MSYPALEVRDPLVGTRVDGRYIILGVLGRGGMGVVYDGMHEQLGRPVAIKVLGPGVAGDANAVQRFLREARIASQLTHGNIVDVSDLGQLPDGRPYLVMAKLNGTDLSRVLERNGPQSPGRTVELLRGAAAALDLVHAKGFVHRDVKPENLMHIVREDGSEAVLLLDFGIVGLASPDVARLTAEGVVFGTPCYLAPEVVRGEPPSQASDTYALATVAFELMAGRAPFVATNVMQLLQMKLAQNAPSMSEVSGSKLDSAVEAVVAQSLARDPSLRHRSPGAFISALATAIQTGPTGQLVAQPSQAVTTGTVDIVEVFESTIPTTRDGAEANSNGLENRPENGLDEQARERLASGDDALEMSFDNSMPTAVPTVSGAIVISSKPPLPPRNLPKPQLLVAGAVAALLLIGGGVWLFTPPAVKPAVFVPPSAASPAQVEPASAPNVVPPATTPSPSPSPSPSPTKPEPPARAASAPAAKREPANAKRELTKASSAAPAPQPAAPTATTKQPPPAAAAPTASGPSAASLITKAQDELIQGHLFGALNLYEQATRADAQNAAAFRGLGLVNERLGHNAAALRALRRAIALAPSDPKNAVVREHIQRLENAP